MVVTTHGRWPVRSMSATTRTPRRGAVVRVGPLGDGTTVSSRETPSPSALADETRLSAHSFPRDTRRGVSRISSGIACISTTTGTHPPKTRRPLKVSSLRNGKRHLFKGHLNRGSSGNRVGKIGRWWRDSSDWFHRRNAVLRASNRGPKFLHDCSTSSARRAPRRIPVLASLQVARSSEFSWIPARVPSLSVAAFVEGLNNNIRAFQRWCCGLAMRTTSA